MSVDRLRVGGLKGLSDWPEGPNLVTNPDFAGGMTGWKDHHPAISVEAGGHMLYVDTAIAAKANENTGQDLELSAGWYVVRARVGAVRQTKPTGGLRLVLKTPHGIGGATEVAKGPTGGVWTIIERRFLRVAEAGRCELRIECYQSPDGVFMVSDVELRQLQAPRVSSFLLYPNWRGVLFEDAPQTVKVLVNSDPNDIAGVQVFNTDGRWSSALFSRGRNQIIEFDASTWPLGTYRIRVWPWAAGGDDVALYPGWEIVKLPSSAREAFGTYIDEAGRLMTPHGPRFVVGVYDQGGYGPAKNEEAFERTEDVNAWVRLNYTLQRIPAKDFKVLSEGSDQHDPRQAHIQVFNRVSPHYPANWKELSCAGLAASGFATTEAFWRCKLGAWKASPGLLGWYIADEVEAERRGEVFALAKIVEELHPGGVTFAALNAPHEAELWAGIVDVLDVHSYPRFDEPAEKQAPLYESSDAIASAIAATHRARPVWAVLQWCDLTAEGSFPTEADVRFLAWDAIVRGCLGIVWWSIGNQGGGSGGAVEPLKAELIARLAAVNESIQAREAAILSPTEPSESSSISVRTMAKRGPDGRGHLWAVNTSKHLLPVTVGAFGRQFVLVLEGYGVMLLDFETSTGPIVVPKAFEYSEPMEMLTPEEVASSIARAEAVVASRVAKQERERLAWRLTSLAENIGDGR